LARDSHRVIGPLQRITQPRRHRTEWAKLRAPLFANKKGRPATPPESCHSYKLRERWENGCFISRSLPPPAAVPVTTPPPATMVTPPNVCHGTLRVFQRVQADGWSGLTAGAASTNAPTIRTERSFSMKSSRVSVVPDQSGPVELALPFWSSFQQLRVRASRATEDFNKGAPQELSWGPTQATARRRAKGTEPHRSSFYW